MPSKKNYQRLGMSEDVPIAVKTLRHKLIAEFLGTYLLLLIGLGVNCTAVLSAAQVGQWQVAIVWGIAVTLCVYATSDISGAHLNPAISVTMAIFKSDTHFTYITCVYYSLTQLIAAIASAATVYLVYLPYYSHYEDEHNITRGESNSIITASTLCCYFPNPCLFPDNHHLVSPLHAFAVEIMGTALLTFLAFALSDPHNKTVVAAPQPILLGTGVANIISIFAPLTQAGINPARDLGPRIVAYIAGWGSVAFPGPNSGFWVYQLGPFIGGPLGALIYTYILQSHQPDHHRTAKIENTQQFTSLLQDYRQEEWRSEDVE